MKDTPCSELEDMERGEKGYSQKAACTADFLVQREGDHRTDLNLTRGRKGGGLRTGGERRGGKGVS